MAELNGTPEFKGSVRRLETTDPKHPDTWNPTHQDLLNNTVFLKEATDAAQEALGLIDQRVGGLETSNNSAPAIASGMRLNWLYSNNKVAFELFQPTWTLIDIAAIAVQSAIAGDDSIDVASTAGLTIGNEYVISDANHRETFKVSQILTANRVRIEGVLTNGYGNTAQVARTSFAVNAGQATAVAGDVYFSKSITLGSDGIPRAVIVRRSDNATNVRLFFTDAMHPVWTEAIWSWKRSGSPVPDGFADYEYPVPANGDARLKLVIEGGGATISHLIAVGAATQLGGLHNPPSTPVNSYPADNAVALPERPTLTLSSYTSPVGTALAGVQFQMATAVNGFAAPFVDSGTLPAGLSWQVPAGRLAISTAYWFRGRVLDAAGAWSGWSAPTKLTTAASFVYIAAPTNTSPAASATNIGATPTLSSSAFAVVGGADTHAASQWQIRASNGTYAAPAWNPGDDAVNKTTIVVPAGILSAGTTTYYWRVRHKGTTNGYSEWSAETPFTTQANFGQIVGIALLSTGGGSGTWARIDENGNAKTTDAAYFNAHPTYAGVVAQTIDSQAMIKVPAFYYKAGTISSGAYAGKKALWICDQPQPGYTLHPAFMNAGAAIAQFWVGKYQGTSDGGTKLGSAAGVTPLVSIDFPTMQARATARNTGGVTGFMMWSIYQLAAIQMLALIEMGGADSQSLIGQGNVNGSAALATDNATTAQALWRGIVGLWGNVWQMVDGLQTDASSKYIIWDRSGNKTFQTTTRTAPSSGYPVTMAEDTGANFDLRDIFAASTTDATAGNGTYGDYFWQAASCVAYHGGTWGSGASAGLFSLHVYYAASHSYTSIGGRLAKV